jgi:long-chain fatty acid transport protein
MRRRGGVHIAVHIGVCIALAAPSPARANALDTFGFTARAGALGGAVCADAPGFAGAHHNPAGVALADDVQVSVGYGGAVAGLQLDGRDAQVTNPHGTSIGLALPAKLGGWTFAFGLALYMPDQFVVRIQLVPSTEPHFVLLDNNLEHIVVTPVLAVRPARWLAIGAGATILADAAGNGITFDVGVVGGDKVGKASLDVALPIRAAPVLGVQVTPHPSVRLGAAWRGEVDLGLKLDILANVDIAGAITGDTLISLRAINFYTPHKVSLGASVDVLRDLTVDAQVDWVGWSYFHGALPDLHTLANLSIAPPLVEALFPSPRFKDIWVPRLGVEWRRDVRPRVGVAARIGYAFEASPVPPQRGLTSFADNDRHVVAFGGGVELRRLWRVLPKPLRLDFAMQLHQLVGRTTVKDPQLFPGQGFSSGGWLLHFSSTLEARF